MSTYLTSEQYADLVEALRTIEPDAVTGRVEADQIKIALGEQGGIWPVTIREDDEDD